MAAAAASAQATAAAGGFPGSTAGPGQPFWGRHARPAGRPTYWAILYRDNGSLEFLSLPDFTLMYVVLNFHMGEFEWIYCRC